MKTNEHSQSTWTNRESEYDPTIWEIMADGSESPVAEVHRWRDEDGNDSDEAKANLALMTASPSLLEACRMVVERWEHGDLAEAARACQDAIDAYEAA